jgi:hypothetical protein
LAAGISVAVFAAEIGIFNGPVGSG